MTYFNKTQMFDCQYDFACNLRGFTSKLNRVQKQVILFETLINLDEIENVVADEGQNGHYVFQMCSRKYFHNYNPFISNINGDIFPNLKIIDTEFGVVFDFHHLHKFERIREKP